MSDKPFILFIDGKNDNGVNFYRVKQPFLKMMERENCYCALRSMLSEDEFTEWLEKTDIIFTHTTSEKFYGFMKENKKGRKVIKVVIDEDDDVFSVSPYNPGYNSFGVKEVDFFLEDGKKETIRDGKNGFDIEANKRRLYFYSKCLQLADAVTTPSSVLCGMMKRWNPHVYKIPNFLDFRIWNPLKIQSDGFIRIGYQCGWSHYEDFWKIRDVLLEILIRHKNVKLVIFGQAYMGALQGFPMDRVEIHSWVGNEAYPYKMKTLAIDVGIAPLENSEFNSAKSELKWEEYSSLSIPTVAENIPPYTLAIEDGKTGYLCGSDKEWIEALEILIGSEESRKKMGERAMEYVRENYDLDKCIKDYETLFLSLTRGKSLVLV